MRTNAEENAVDSLERAAEFLQRPDLPSWLKWLAIALHHSLYGFLVCTLVGGNYERVTTKKGGLISFWTALKRAQDPTWMHLYEFSKALELSDDQRKAIVYLTHELRNPFQHLVPREWAIETQGVERVIRPVVSVIEFLAFECGNVIPLTEAWRARTKRAIRTIRQVLSASRHPGARCQSDASTP